MSEFDIVDAKRRGCLCNGMCVKVLGFDDEHNNIWFRREDGQHGILHVSDFRNLPITDPTSKDYAGPWPEGWEPVGEFRKVCRTDEGWLGAEGHAYAVDDPKGILVTCPRHILRRKKQPKPETIRVAVQVERNKRGYLEVYCYGEFDSSFDPIDRHWICWSGNTVFIPRTVVELPSGKVVDEHIERITQLKIERDDAWQQLTALRAQIAAIKGA